MDEDRCGGCGNEVGWDANFCDQCGRKIDRTSQSSLGAINEMLRDAYACRKEGAQIHMHRQNNGKTVVIVITFP